MNRKPVNIEACRQLFLKVERGEQLSDTEIDAGVDMYEQFVEDMRETPHYGVANDAEDFLNKLKQLQQQRRK